MDFDAVADELYALPPDEFTARRDARAAEARASGDRELAAAIKLLRRPSLAAWVVNLLARERTDQLNELLDLGDAMREAQESLAGDDLRRLSRQRRQVVVSLGREGRRLGVAAGHSVSDAAEREVESTLDAALADPGAAEVVRCGRLTAALTYSGMGAASGVGAAGVGAAGPRPAPQRAGGRPGVRSGTKAEGDVAGPDTTAVEAAAIEAAEAALALATQTARARREISVHAAQAAEESARQAEALEAQIATLEEQLGSRRRELEEASTRLRAALEARDDAMLAEQAALDGVANADIALGRASAARKA